jgi:hypothetical protein
MADAKAVVIDTSGMVRNSATGDVVVVPGLKDSALSTGKIPVATTDGQLIDGPTDASTNWNSAVSHKTTEDALTGLVKCDGAGNYSAVVDYSANWINNYNYLINGGFDFFQRTAPETLTAVANDAYGPDRWNILTQTTTVQIQRVAGAFFSYHGGILKQNQAAAQRMGMEQILETVTSLALRNRTITVQAQIKCSSSQPIRIAILEWTGTADTPTSNVVRDWTSGTFTANNFFLASNLTVTAVAAVTPTAYTWTPFSVSGTVSGNCINLIVFIWTEGTAAQNVTLDITEAGLYTGTQIRNWEPRFMQQEIALCQRYYEKSYELDIPPGTASYDSSMATTMVTAIRPGDRHIQYQTKKVAANAPTLWSVKTANTSGVTTNTDDGLDCTSLIDYASSSGATWYVSAGGIAGHSHYFHWSISCEL